MSFLLKIKTGAKRKAALNKLTPFVSHYQTKKVLSYEQMQHEGQVAWGSKTISVALQLHQLMASKEGH